jgi:hypothetical protein
MKHQQYSAQIFQDKYHQWAIRVDNPKAPSLVREKKPSDCHGSVWMRMHFRLACELVLLFTQHVAAALIDRIESLRSLTVSNVFVGLSHV